MTVNNDTFHHSDDNLTGIAKRNIEYVKLLLVVDYNYNQLVRGKLIVEILTRLISVYRHYLYY